MTHRFDIDVTAVAGIGPAHMAAELFLPSGPAKALLVCLPGGGMNRRYFDLPTPSGEPEVSFAAALTARGFAVASLDPLGVGASTLPDDPYRLDPDRVAAAAGFAARHLRDAMRAGTLVPGLTRSPDLRSVGIGHSFGALLTMVHQAADPVHDAVALFGFQTRGLPAYANPEDLARDPADVRARLVELAGTRFAEPFLTLEAPPSKRAVSVAVAMDRILATTSLMAMIPDIVASDAAAITVPVLLALGDGDLHDAPHAAPAAYTGSSHVTLLVLRDTRHNHFLYASRTWLFDRLAAWIDAL